MGNLQNYSNNMKPSYMESIGQKVKNVVDMGIAAKKVYDVGKMVYQGFEAAAPMIELAMRAGL